MTEPAQANPSALAANVFIEAAKQHLKEGRAKEAVALLQPAVSVWPANGRLQHQLGMAMLGLGDGAGIKHLAEAVKLEPTNVDRLADLAEAMEALGDRQAADLWFRRTLARAPTREDLIVRFATLHGRSQRYAEAERWMMRALALRLRYGHGHTVLGVTQQRSGDLAKAVGTLYRAVQNDPEYTEGYVALAAALQAGGLPLQHVMVPAKIAADRNPAEPGFVIPYVQYLRDIGEEAAYVRYATRLIDEQMQGRAKDEIGAHGIRILHPDVLLTRIGEFAFQLDLHVKMKKLGWLPPFVTLLLAPKDQVCNQAFLDCWRPYVTVVDDPRLIESLEPLRQRLAFNPVYVRLPDGRSMSKNRAFFAVQQEWQRQGRGPLLDLTRAQIERGRAVLKAMGVPDEAWFVCVHVRESGFLQEAAGTSEATRNADIGDYADGLQEIVNRGGWVIRLGDASMKPLPPMPQVIDYARSPYKSQEMDIFLAACCRFFFGTTSGMCIVSSAFGVPVGGANFFPAGERLVTQSDVVVPKLYRERASGRILSFNECLTMPLALTYDATHVESLGFDVIDTDAEDLRDLAIEMLERTEGRRPYDAEDERLQKLWDELSHSFSTGDVGCRIGRGFLRRHRHLFKAA